VINNSQDAPYQGAYCIHTIIRPGKLVARKIGFQGNLCIHPSQVAAASRLFAPDPDKVAFCRRVVAEFAAAVARGLASITVDGVFVDYPIAEKAERIIRTGEILAARDAAAVSLPGHVDEPRSAA
jgi:hypothetical protein